jgi:hypothetical protein
LRRVIFFCTLMINFPSSSIAALFIYASSRRESH